MTDSTSAEKLITDGTRKFYAAIALAAGALRMLSVPLVGQLPISELILLLLVGHTILWLLLNHRLPARFQQPGVVAIVITCQLIGLASYIVSDFLRDSYPVDMIRGWLRMIFLLIDIGCLTLIFGNSPVTFILVQIGTCFSGLQFLLMPPIFGDYWKFAFGTPVTVAILLLIPRWLGWWGSIAACFGLGVLHIVMDFRSMAGTCFILGAVQIIYILPSRIRKILVGTLGIIILFALPWISGHMLGEAEGRANRSNVERSAMLQAAWEAFEESPLIGHGSWFGRSNVMDNFLSIRKIQSTIGGGGGMGFDNKDFEGVTIHSQVLTAMAEGGLLGGTFFYCMILLMIWSLWFITTIQVWHWQTPIRLFVLSCSLFDVMMSPFSGTHRLNISITTALTLLILQEARARKTASATPPIRQVNRLKPPVSLVYSKTSQ